MMCDINIKIEPGNQEICRGCLSSDRRLAFVAIGDYCYLLTEDQKLDALSSSCIALCWECRALLRRTQRFREQVQKAYAILQDSLHLSPAKPTLSSLTFHRKLEYDAVLKENKPFEVPLFNKASNSTIDYVKVIIPTKYKTTDKKSDPAEKKEGYIESIQDDTKNIFTNNSNKNNHTKIEPASSDNDDTEIFEADDRNYSSSEDISEIKIEKVMQVPKVTRSSVPIVKPHLQNNVFKKKGTYGQTKMLNTKQVYRKVKTESAPLIKTPEMLKLEIELKKFMANKTGAAEETKDSQKKCNKNRLVDIVDKDNEVSKHDENETKTRKQKMAELDPDFNLEVDVDDYATDDSEEFKPVQKKKTKISGTDPDIDDDTTNKRTPCRTITLYKTVEDVLPYFTEIEMSEHDLRSVLEKDDAIVNKNKPINCTICGMVFQRQKTLTRHGYRTHKGKYPGRYIKGKWNNPPPVFNLKSVWHCSRCDRMMRQEHILAHFNEYHRGQFRCTADGCEWIEKPFWVKEHLDQHWDTVHKKAVCDVCGKTKTTKRLIERHIKSAHAPPIPRTTHECTICSKRLSSRHYLQAHYQLVHEAPSEPVELRYCVECDVTFKRILTFRVHFKEKHSGAREMWPCEQCDKVLASKISLQQHVAFAHTGKTQYSCHICGKYFSRKHSLITHLNAHNNIRDPKKIPCTVCGRMFQNNRILRYHMYTHTGERPYKCPHCETAFTQPHCLRAHLAKQHQVEARVRTDGTIVLATTTNETVDEVQK